MTCALLCRCSFLLAITQFVVPTFAFVKSSPIPFVTHDVALTGTCPPACIELNASMPTQSALSTSTTSITAITGNDQPAGDEPHEASGDLFLSPTVRLLADTPGGSHYEYRGGGHRMVLPDKEHLGE